MAFGVKSKSMAAVRGGSGKMFGRGRTGTQTPGQTATKPKATGGKFPSGGKTKMFGKSGAMSSKAC